MSELTKKIRWLESKGLNIYQSPSIKEGILKAKDFSKFVYETLLYLKNNMELNYWEGK